MKNLIFTLICFTLLSNCKKDTSKSTTEKNGVITETNKKSYDKVIDFNCDTFFKKGDYSSLCFTDSKLPEYNSRGCIYSFVTKGDKHKQDIKIQFTNKKSAMLAEMHYNLKKNNYKKGVISDVSNLGDAAFFDVHRTELKSLSTSNKDLHIRYNNITFVIMVTYQSNTKMPCFYNDKDLIAFAKAIIKNLE
ncbi:hypothetical protein AAFN75_09935 [Algibacter sp. AS12]|uniref:hypothetical protein n=1 Tax=Algibacter sp. AS12 TaxID=3135773 RepID=UPI00398BB5E6